MPTTYDLLRAVPPTELEDALNQTPPPPPPTRDTWRVLECVERARRAIERGDPPQPTETPKQAPFALYLPWRCAQPLHDAASFPWAEELSRATPAIRAE